MPPLHEADGTTSLGRVRGEKGVTLKDTLRRTCTITERREKAEAMNGRATGGEKCPRIR